LCEFAIDVYVLLQASRLKRHKLEQAVACLARGQGRLTVVQKPAGSGLFGRQGGSGIRHEVDAGILAPDWVGLVEVKSSTSGVSKNDVLIFDGKTQDLYVDRILAHRRGPHYRFLVGTQRIPKAIAALAMQRAIITVEPDLMPLPMLLRLLRKPAIYGGLQHVDPGGDIGLLVDASRPMESLWQQHGWQLQTSLARLATQWASHARELHETWSSRLTEWLGNAEPYWAERRREAISLRLESFGLFRDVA
jgi:hypothetical protein